MKVTAAPPFHAIALVGSVLALCILTIPNMMKSIDTVATVEQCTSPLFPQLMTRQQLGWIRCSFALLIFLVSVRRSFEVSILEVSYLKGSKLKQIPMDLSGIKAQGAFTSFSWNLLGLTFAYNGILTLYIDHGITNGTFSDDISPLPQWSLRASILLFETAAPTTMLVAAVTRYVLWERALKNKGSKNLRRITTLFQHNANVIMALTEVGLLGGLPVRFSDTAVAGLWGIAYIIFSWAARFSWLPSGEPQFLYFFLDTTLPGYTYSIALFSLVMVLLVFYTLFVCVDDIMLLFGGGPVVHALVVLITSSIVCRFRD